MMTPERQIAELIEQECAYYNNEENDSETSHNSPMAYAAHNDTWRKMIVKWCYTVVDHINADREVVYIAVHILDRFLQSQLTKPCSKRKYLTDRKDYEAAVITSLLITLKLHSPSSVCIDDILELSRSSVTSRDIVEVGQTLVENLQWKKQIPTAARFAHALVDMLPRSVMSETRQTLFEECVFAIELSVQNQSCSSELPSLIAWMALENAMASHFISEETRICFRAKVSKVTGLRYDASIRRYLSSLHSHAIIHGDEDNYNHNNNNDINNKKPILVTVIPPDEDDDSHLYSSYVQYSSSMSSYYRLQQGHKADTRATIIEPDSYDRTRMKRTISKENYLPRSKRVRAFS